MMNIPCPDPRPLKRTSALEGHINALLLLVHSKSLALSDLSEVGNQPSRPLSPAELLLASAGNNAHEITLAIEAVIEAVRAERDRRRTRLCSMLLLTIPVLFIGVLIGASYGIEEGRWRERHAKDHAPLPMLVDTEALVEAR